MSDTLADNLDRLKSSRTAIGNAIVAKGGTVNSGDGFEDFPNDINTIPSGGSSILIPKTITENGIYDPSDDSADGYSSVVVDVPSSPTQDPKTVFFYDYDGTVVASYTKEEFAALSALPANPSHTGLTSQGWNWSLSDAQTYVNSYGSLDIGQMYVTDDGRTRIYVTLPEDYTTPMFKLYLPKNVTVDVDWGDGSPHSILEYTTGSSTYSFIGERHTYATPGNYVISFAIASGTTAIIRGTTYSQILSDDNGSQQSGDGVYISCINKIEFGSNVILSQYAFDHCLNLQTITMPNDISYHQSSDGYQFRNCESLKHITIPTSLTTLRQWMFGYCYNMETVSFPNTITEIQPNSCFEDCYKLTHITLPSVLVNIGKHTFYECIGLTELIMPNSVTTLGENCFGYCDNLTKLVLSNSISSAASYTFGYCGSLIDITIPNGVTTLGSYMFAECRSIKEVILPNTITSMGTYVFQNCSSLEKINIPTSLDTIPQQSFINCRNLKDIEIPSNVTTINSSAFIRCDSLNITIPSTVTAVKASAFAECIKMTEATLCAGTTYEQSAFSGCYNIRKATIEEGVTELPQAIFSNNGGIIELTIPSTVTSIKSSALSYCRSLKTLKFVPTTPPTVTASSSFSGIPTTCKILVPAGTLEAYTKAQYYPNSSTYTYEEY